MKEKIKKWYKQELWSAEMVQNAVGKTFGGVPFTEADHAEIVGKEEVPAD